MIMDTSIIKEKVSNINWGQLIIAFLIAFILGGSITFMMAHNYYEKKLDSANEKLTNYDSKYAESIDAKEKAIVAKALAEAKSNKPEVVYTKGDTVTEVIYTQKETAVDPDVKLTVAKPVFKFSYNGKSFDMPTTSKDGTAITDGTLSISQQTSSVMNVDDIVNREIARTVSNSDKEIAVLKRQKIQQSIWGTAIGIGIGSLIKK